MTQDEEPTAWQLVRMLSRRIVSDAKARAEKAKAASEKRRAEARRKRIGTPAAHHHRRVDWVRTDPEIDYASKKILYRLGQRLHHWDERIRIDIEAREDYLTMDDYRRGIKTPIYDRTDRWTRWNREELMKGGYIRCDGLYDSIIWWGVPVYIRIKGLEQFDVHRRDEFGEWLYSQEGPTRLNDIMTADLMGRALKSFNRVQMGKMDIQKIIMIAILGAGLLFGLSMLGVFRWS